MDDLMLNVDFAAPERRPKKESGNAKHQRFVRRRRELERRGVLRQKQLPAAPGGPRRAPGRRTGKTGGGPGKPRSGQPRSCPKENGSAAAPPCPPVSQNGPTGIAVSAKTKGKGRGAPRGTSKSGCAPPAPSKLVAMDCEMVGTGPGGRTSALARCSIVTYEGDVVYDQYVRPEAPIVDYRTRWSGIRPRHMANAVPFRRAQQEVRGSPGTGWGM